MEQKKIAKIGLGIATVVISGIVLYYAWDNVNYQRQAELERIKGRSNMREKSKRALIEKHVNESQARKSLDLHTFHKIQSGMTLNQVTRIIGFNGTEHENKISKNPNDRLFSWKSSDGKSVVIIFRNNKVFMKNQVGLGITLAQYKRVKTGQTYAQAIKILHMKGTEMSQNEVMNIKTIMYMWKNPDGSNMNAMFQNGKLINKAQFGLK